MATWDGEAEALLANFGFWFGLERFTGCAYDSVWAKCVQH